MNRNVIVSGATGFIGLSLLDFLLKDENNTIYALVYKSDSLPRIYSDSNRIVVIYCDLERTDNDFSRIPTGIDVFFHFAWLGVKPEQRNLYELQYRNINLTMNCLLLAKEKKVKKFISPGSTNEYLYSGGPINKNSIPTPRDSYGAVKVALRYLQKQFLRNEHIDFIYVIIAGVYSERRTDNNVITYTIRKLLNGEKPSLSKCEQLWDYVHVDDVMEALVAVSQNGKSEMVYSIGHGDNWALYNYIRIIHNKIDPSLPLGIGDVPYRESVLPMSCMDLTDLKKDTGFVPKISFEDGISRVIKAMRDEMKDK